MSEDEKLPSEQREIERLLWDEALDKLITESLGHSNSIGPMEQSYPEEFELVLDLVSSVTEKTPPYLYRSMWRAEKLSEMLHSDEEGLNSIEEFLNKHPPNALTLARLISLERDQIPSLLEKQIKEVRSQSASHAANARYNQPGGYREKKEEMRRLWATGKYKSRDKCAEQEHERLHLSYRAARDYLKRTPDPT